MFRLVTADQAIANPVSAVSTLGKYNGMDVEIALNGSTHPITFLRSNATGERASDELSLEFIWRYDDPDDFLKVYNGLRSNMNKVLRVRVGRDEFLGLLVDTTKIAPGAQAADALKHKFVLVLSNVRSTRVAQAEHEVTSKAHESSIVEVLVPPNVWAQVSQSVPYAKDLEDPPHITLVYLKLKPAHVEEAKAALQELCSSWACFQVNVTGAGSFPSDKAKVPHFARIESLDLVKFRECVVDCMQAIDPDMVDIATFPEFTPHLTLQFVDKDEPLPVVKPISWLVKDIDLSVKGTEKFGFPLSFTRDQHGVAPSVEPGQKIEASIVTTKALSQLAGSISDRLTALGYKREAQTVDRAAEAIEAEKKKKKKDKSVEKFVDKLRSQLQNFVHVDHIDHATDSILNLLTDGTDVEAPDSDGPSGDAGGSDGGDGGGVEAAAPFNDGGDSHSTPRRKGPQTQSHPTDAPEGTKAVPFMERNYSAEAAEQLREWLKSSS